MIARALRPDSETSQPFGSKMASGPATRTHHRPVATSSAVAINMFIAPPAVAESTGAGSRVGDVPVFAANLNGGEARERRPHAPSFASDHQEGGCSSRSPRYDKRIHLSKTVLISGCKAPVSDEIAVETAICSNLADAVGCPADSSLQRFLASRGA